jgi:glycosyltransferase involved in cell wall biosynthesis
MSLIWNITLYEPLPVGGEGIRPMRSALLTKSLVQAGHKVELWLPGFEHVHHRHFRQESVLEKHREGFEIQYLKALGYSSDTSIKRIFHNHAISKEFYKIAEGRKRKPDLIITQIPALELAEAVVNYAKARNIPVIVDIRDLWPDVYKRLLPSWAQPLYHVLFFTEIRRVTNILSNCSAITAVSKTFLKWAEQYSQKHIIAKSEVFYIGYPADKDAGSNKQDIGDFEKKYKVSSKKFNVVFIGTFCTSYELQTVFEAAAILAKIREAEIEILIAGGGDDEDKIKKKCNESPNMNFLGWLDYNELQCCLTISSLGLAPYSKNSLMSLPNKPFEYMASALPILTSLGGELREIVETYNVGAYYSPGDSQALADLINQLFVNQDNRECMSRNAELLYKERFMSEPIYADYSKFVNCLIN